jgi:hypothetical protein
VIDAAAGDGLVRQWRAGLASQGSSAIVAGCQGELIARHLGQSGAYHVGLYIRGPLCGPWPTSRPAVSIQFVNELVPVSRAASAPISIDAARQALDNAGDVATVASLVDRLEVIRVAARKARTSHEAQNDWATLKLEAERKAGRMLGELRTKGSLRAGRPNADSPSALADLGIEQQQSSRWQRLAAVPEERFSRWVQEVRGSGSEVTEAGLFALAVVWPLMSFTERLMLPRKRSAFSTRTLPRVPLAARAEKVPKRHSVHRMGHYG